MVPQEQLGPLEPQVSGISHKRLTSKDLKCRRRMRNSSLYPSGSVLHFPCRSSKSAVDMAAAPLRPEDGRYAAVVAGARSLAFRQAARGTNRPSGVGQRCPPLLSRLCLSITFKVTPYHTRFTIIVTRIFCTRPAGPAAGAHSPRRPPKNTGTAPGERRTPQRHLRLWRRQPPRR